MTHNHYVNDMWHFFCKAGSGTTRLTRWVLNHTRIIQLALWSLSLANWHWSNQCRSPAGGLSTLFQLLSFGNPAWLLCLHPHPYGCLLTEWRIDQLSSTVLTNVWLNSVPHHWSVTWQDENSKYLYRDSGFIFLRFEDLNSNKNL